MGVRLRCRPREFGVGVPTNYVSLYSFYDFKLFVCEKSP
ncbi:hypothetical protein LEP1GSC168_0863 [Leptospira santarosai str. HAI134]|nr:hypothetical protein LEP1GSC168_0863 [Leptospira santarosai str. HAI134]